jgi:hypothetical protein
MSSEKRMISITVKGKAKTKMVSVPLYRMLTGEKKKLYRTETPLIGTKKLTRKKEKIDALVKWFKQNYPEYLKVTEAFEFSIAEIEDLFDQYGSDLDGVIIQHNGADEPIEVSAKMKGETIEKAFLDHFQVALVDHKDGSAYAETREGKKEKIDLLNPVVTYWDFSIATPVKVYFKDGKAFDDNFEIDEYPSKV